MVMKKITLFLVFFAFFYSSVAVAADWNAGGSYLGSATNMPGASSGGRSWSRDYFLASSVDLPGFHEQKRTVTRYRTVGTGRGRRRVAYTSTYVERLTNNSGFNIKVKYYTGEQFRTSRSARMNRTTTTNFPLVVNGEMIIVPGGSFTPRRRGGGQSNLHGGSSWSRFSVTRWPVEIEIMSNPSVSLSLD
jgi:hypothetical protein